MTTFTVRNIPMRGKMFAYEPSIVTFHGTIVPNPFGIPIDYICLTTGDADFPVRAIRKSDIVGAPIVMTPPKTKTWSVRGSRGDNYTVAFKGGHWSCTCVGFGFRHTCKHVNQIKEENE